MFIWLSEREWSPAVNVSVANAVRLPDREEVWPLLERASEVVRVEGVRVSTHPPQLRALNGPGGWRWAVVCVLTEN